MAASEEQLTAATGEPAPDGGLAARQPLLRAGNAPVRLAVMIDDGRAFIVTRDFTLSEEDCARLEERAADLLETYDLGLGGLTLNGIKAAVGPAT